MLQHFTWQQFLVAACILSFIWYVVVLFIFYREEAKRLLKGKGGPGKVSEPLPHRWADEDEFEEEPEADNLMGKPVLPEGLENVGAGDFSFASASSKEEQIGLIPDVLEELKTIFNILAKEDGTKKDFFSLLELVKAKYGPLGSHPQIRSVNAFIREGVPFHLSNEELEDLWD
jgi:hypothetical protein